MSDTDGHIVALDIGSKRIGVAAAHNVARLPQPLTTLSVDDNIIGQIKQLLTDQQATTLVLGLPRGLDGQETAQTTAVRAFGEQLQSAIELPIVWQDEALTSHISEEALEQQGGSYKKGDVDAMAASYILRDFLLESQND